MAPQPRTSLALLAVGALLTASTLQVLASLQRWVTASDSWSRTDSTIEDHRFDYFVPTAPWEPIGVAAALLGFAFLLLAVAIVALTLAIRRSGAVSGISRLIAAVAALPFAILGVHGLLSGLIGTPSFLAAVASPWLSFLCVVGLLALVGLWATQSIVLALSALALMGNTIMGYLIAAFVIAPAITGYQSYDTTPWTETIVAASPAIAALLIVVDIASRGRARVAATSREALIPAR